MQQRILVIEDNKDLSDLIRMHLKDRDWEADTVLDGNTGFKLARTRAYDLIILDVMLPGLDGFEILKQLRQRGIQTPVLMLTSKSDEIDRILGLEFGADDYVTKPFSVRELIARINAIFRRIDMAAGQHSKQADSKTIRCHDLVIEPEKRKVTLRGNDIDLTAREYDLLWFFASHPGRVFNRSQLLDRVWGYGHDGYEHTVNSNINRLRAKIEETPSTPAYILTVWGVGYKFRDD